MASISNDPNGRRRIQFIDGQGQRKTIRLGKVSLRSAESVKVKVEDLVSSTLTGHSPADETARWLAGLDDALYAKLANVGLARPRAQVTLTGWLDQYLTERRDDLKPESLRKLEQTKTKLLAHFNPKTPLRNITMQDAAGWRGFLKKLGLSEAAIKTHSGNAKTLIAEAVRRKLIAENPFALLKSGPTPSRYTRYITPEEIDRVIEACPNAQWRLLFGLARYAGLRIPSESHLLTWADVDFDRARLTVRSPKTEHHAGHERRFVPITPKLMKLLQDRFDECEEGDQRLVTIRGKGAVQRQVEAICDRAGIELWERLWQTLRQSCEKEWAMSFPQYAVSKWIGHSITISGRHYANDVPDELFERAAKTHAPQAAQNAAQKLHERGGSGKKRKTAPAEAEGRNSSQFRNLRDISVSPELTSTWSRGELNPRPVTVNRPLLRV